MLNNKDNPNGNAKVSIDQLKQIYEEQEIPNTLSQLIRDTIDQVEKEKQGENKMNENIKKVNAKSHWKGLVGIAAAVIVFIGAFGVGVNTNEAFAATMRDVPVLGNLVKVFTAEEIQQSDDVSTVDMKIPGIEGLKDKDLQDKINKEVYDKVNKAVTETKQQMAEAKEAWLATGGTEEDYVPMEIIVDYEVKCIDEDILSFKVWKTQTLASAYFEEFYYNYDLNKNRELTLMDMLGKDYISKANQQIASEIAERSKDENNMFFDGSDGIDGFSTITPDQNFYVNADGNPVIIFNKYEIAPGYMGIQEFEIK